METGNKLDGCSLLLLNGRFANVENGCYYEDGTSLMIEGGRIVHILPPGFDPMPEIDAVIDLQGRHVIPGLFNTHCHIQMTLPSMLTNSCDILLNIIHYKEQLEKNMSDCLLHGVTHIRDAWTDSLSGNQTLKKKIDSGMLQGPRIYQSILIGPENGCFTTKRNPFIRTAFRMRKMPTVAFDNKDSGVVSFPDHAGMPEIKNAVDCAIDERGARFIKLYEQKQDWFTGNYNTRSMTQE